MGHLWVFLSSYLEAPLLTVGDSSHYAKLSPSHAATDHATGDPTPVALRLPMAHHNILWIYM